MLDERELQAPVVHFQTENSIKTRVTELTASHKHPTLCGIEPYLLMSLPLLFETKLKARDVVW
jgi:hypothetical protein